MEKLWHEEYLKAEEADIWYNQETASSLGTLTR